MPGGVGATKGGGRSATRWVIACLAAGLAFAGPAMGHPTQPLDADHDGVTNFDDICPDVFDAHQQDTDADGTPGRQEAPDRGGDACDVDDDGDAVDDAVDGCPLLADPEQRDTDSDGEGDLCDDDDDADGVRDVDDACTKVADPDQADHDNDFVGDACDPDAPRRRATFVALGRKDRDDHAAPRVTLRAPRRASRAQLRRGLSLVVRCSEACAAFAELRRGGTVLARADSAVAARGSTFVFLRSRRGRGRLVVALEVVDASGNTRRLHREVRVR